MNECYDCGSMFESFGDCPECGSSNVSIDRDYDIPEEDEDEDAVFEEMRLEDDMIAGSIWEDEEEYDYDLEEEDD